MRLTALLIGLAIVLAGCAGNSAPDTATEDDGFQDKPLEADEKTGVIRGVVVDETISPVPGASVSLTLGEEKQETTADEQGRFGFSKVPPGTHFLKAAAEFHTEVQFSAVVVAGVKDPEVITVQVARLYSGEPFVSPIKQAGFFTCSQANMPPYWYSSSSCHDTYWVDFSDYGVTLDQNRDFHADVGAGWQTQVFEMTWESTAQGTSDRMGMTVSTYKPERNTNHYFASVASKNPMRFQLDVGEHGPGYQEGSGPEGPLPADGLKDMSYFISVRAPEGATCVLWCVPPGLALDQSFTTYLHQFYYRPAPEGWSAVAGHELPF